MYTFRELQKATEKTVDGKAIRVAVVGNCSTQFLAQAIEGYAKLCEQNIIVYDVDYNQIEIQLLDSLSEVYSFNPDAILLWLGTEKIYEEFLGMNISGKMTFAEYYIAKIEEYWLCINKYSTASIIQPVFTEVDDKAFGQYSCEVEHSFIYQLRKLNYYLQKLAKDHAGVYLVDLLAIQINLGRDKYFSSKLYYCSKMSISINALPEVAKAIIDVLLSIAGRIKKCLIFDLDNTIWGGTIGDDGLEGIEIGEIGNGRVFSDLQRWIKQLKDNGIVLAVCSKNNEQTAMEPFEKHEDMILKLSDISLFLANWDDKVTNIKHIQSVLNLGMDSIVFLDDSSFERNYVRESIAGVTVPELPDDPSLWLGFLQKQNYFETSSYSVESSDRTKFYQAESERIKAEKKFKTIDEYLNSLHMLASAKPFDQKHIKRIAELTQRSNQFNLRTVRYTESDIQRIAEDKNYLTVYFTLKDRYGEQGLISIVIMKKQHEDTLFIDTWLMSCRVLKRGMEEFVINKIVQIAKDSGFTTIFAEYIPTPKNKMVSTIYDSMGFNRIDENIYCLKISDFKEKLTFIKEE